MKEVSVEELLYQMWVLFPKEHGVLVTNVYGIESFSKAEDVLEQIISLACYRHFPAIYDFLSAWVMYENKRRKRYNKRMEQIT